MDSLSIPYVVIPADIDEKVIRDTDLAIRAKKIARAKGEKVASEHQGIVISADSFSSCEGKVLEKPITIEEARDMLKFQANKECFFYSGFSYIDRVNGIDCSDVSVSKYVFRKLSDTEIDKFVQNNPVTTWAGGFALSYPYQMSFFKNIEGSLTGCVYGLPTELLIPCLVKSGVFL
jgi:septum formation protein